LGSSKAGWKLLVVSCWLFVGRTELGTALAAALPFDGLGIDLDIRVPTEQDAQAEIPVPLDLDR
jgi:hypothetical protein